MKYMLVLQFPEETFTYDELVELENKFISELKDLAIIDGHDIGAGEANIFILTNDTKDIFKKIKLLLERKALDVLKAAYREIKKEKYEIIYPTNLKKFTVS
jgi:hypothetical protein